jgi:PAS domain-containing protein
MTVNSQLAHQSAQLSAVIASINDGLVVADSEGAVTAANERAVAVLGVRQDVLLSGDVASVAPLLGRRCEGGEEDLRDLRWRLRRRDADPPRWSCASTPLRPICWSSSPRCAVPRSTGSA